MSINVNQPWALTRPAAAAATDPAAELSLNKRADVLASQFEQLLLRQMLSQMRASSLSADAGAEKPSAGYLQMADDQLAGIVASVGGLGLGSTVRRWMKGVEAYQTQPAAAPATSAAPALLAPARPPA